MGSVGQMRERLVWLPIYSLSCAAVGIFAFFATHNNLKVGLVTAALGAAVGALGWLAMQLPQRPRHSCLNDHLTHMEAQIAEIDKLLTANKASYRTVLRAAELALGSAAWVIQNRHAKCTDYWERAAVAAEADIRTGLAAIRKARGT